MSGWRVAFELARWAIGFVLLWRMPSPGMAAGASAHGASVIVPARNEASNLGRLLPSVVPQAHEVIVVDDGSTDATVAVATAHDAAVVDPGTPPQGWAGKPWACDRGAHVATGDVLVFVDADVVVEPGGLDRVVAAQREAGGLVSLQPWHEVHSGYETLSMFPNLIGVMGVGAFSIFGRRIRPRGAFGPCIAIDKRTYDEIGGHASVRGDVIEDVALARLAPKVTLYAGRGILRYRMYPDGFETLFQGWTKNLASGARATHPLVMALVVVWVSGLIQAPVAAPWLFGLFVVQLWWLLRPVGGFGTLAVALYPIPLAFFLAVFGWSVVRTFLARSVKWRGRSVPTR